MEKPTSLFLQVATEYKRICDSIIEDLEKHEENADTTTLSLYQDNLISASELELRVKLLFAEFDKGEIFLERLKTVDAERGFAFSKERLTAYSDVLEIFISHLNTFRL